MNVHPDFPERLDALAEKWAGVYQSALPYPHFVQDDFFDAEFLREVASEFPDLASSEAQEFNNPKEIKWASKGENTFGPKTRVLMHFLNSEPFLKFIQEVSGIKETLIGDPYFVGGGQHEIRPGGVLKVHADFNKYPAFNLSRRLNVLIYLNEDWEESFGGHLELWDRDMKSMGASILPVFNRLAMFSTTDFSYHGHPNPLTCPPDRRRRSLALYYYSYGRPSSELDPSIVSNTTQYVSRGVADKKAFWTPNKANLIHLAKMLTPPILWKLFRNLR
jgi:Rps23 Pro-64 3,4-dihydroxylase Tpa1-like proline 4-hydroxylase